MLSESDLNIVKIANGYLAQVCGRANFESAVPLRELAEEENISLLQVDLAQCSAMDSTFMGVLTMFALKLRRRDGVVELLNASEVLQKLLSDLGVHKLFKFSSGDCSADGCQVGLNAKSGLETAETVVEAHEALTEADESNWKKFEQVIRLGRQDADRLRREQQQ